MNILAWAIFGIVNGLIIHALEPSTNKGGKVAAAFIGASGALAGGAFAYLFFGGLALSVDFTLLMILTLEAGLIALLFAGKAFKAI